MEQQQPTLAASSSSLPSSSYFVSAGFLPLDWSPRWKKRQCKMKTQKSALAVALRGASIVIITTTKFPQFVYFNWLHLVSVTMRCFCYINVPLNSFCFQIDGLLFDRKSATSMQPCRWLKVNFSFFEPSTLIIDNIIIIVVVVMKPSWKSIVVVSSKSEGGTGRSTGWSFTQRDSTEIDFFI